jgi:hypothetical protein
MLRLVGGELVGLLGGRFFWNSSSVLIVEFKYFSKNGS